MTQQAQMETRIDKLEEDWNGLHLWFLGSGHQLLGGPVNSLEGLRVFGRHLGRAKIFWVRI